MTTEEFSGHLLAALHGPKREEIASAVLGALPAEAIEETFGELYLRLFLVCAWVMMTGHRVGETSQERLCRTTMEFALLTLIRKSWQGEFETMVEAMGVDLDQFRQAAKL